MTRKINVYSAVYDYSLTLTCRQIHWSDNYDLSTSEAREIEKKEQ